MPWRLEDLHKRLQQNVVALLRIQPARFWNLHASLSLEDEITNYAEGFDFGGLPMKHIRGPVDSGKLF